MISPASGIQKKNPPSFRHQISTQSEFDRLNTRIPFQCNPFSENQSDMGKQSSTGVEFQIKKPRNTRNTQKIKPTSSMISETSQNKDSGNRSLKSYRNTSHNNFIFVVVKFHPSAGVKAGHVDPDKKASFWGSKPSSPRPQRSTPTRRPDQMDYAVTSAKLSEELYESKEPRTVLWEFQMIHQRAGTYRAMNWCRLPTTGRKLTGLFLEGDLFTGNRRA